MVWLLTITLALAALVCSIISGVLGMGGGTLLLATLFCFLHHREAIPLHGAVQLVSNSTRLVAFIRHVDWKTVGLYACGALPGMVIGAWLLKSLGQPERSEPYLKALVGAYVLVLTFLPKPKKRVEERRYDWTLLGLAAGVVGLFVGAVGPLIAPLFARRNFVKERLVATKAVCQALLHLPKIPIFIWLGHFNYPRFGLLLLVMCLVVIPGTLIGKRLLVYVSAELFTRLYRLALVVAGLKVLVFDGLLKIVGQLS